MYEEINKQCKEQNKEIVALRAQVRKTKSKLNELLIKRRETMQVEAGYYLQQALLLIEKGNWNNSLALRKVFGTSDTGVISAVIYFLSDRGFCDCPNYRWQLTKKGEVCVKTLDCNTCDYKFACTLDEHIPMKEQIKEKE